MHRDNLKFWRVSKYPLIWTPNHKITEAGRWRVVNSGGQYFTTSQENQAGDQILKAEPRPDWSDLHREKITVPSLNMVCQ